VQRSELGEQVSVAVVAPDGEVVFDHHAARLRMPASAAKLITAAAVVETFGVDHRLTTEVIADGEVTDGTLDGDLVLVGGGDPALAHPDFEQVLARWPRTRLEDLADRVAGAVDRVTGDVVADAHAWPDQPTARGWPQRYLDRGYARHISALTVNASTEIVERGGRTLAIPVTDPATEAARALRGLLEDRDVVVDGGAVRGRGPVDGRPVASVEGHPLAVVMAEMVRRSDNVLADGLWRAAGSTQGNGSWQAAERLARGLLDDAGADTEGVVLADGSGLSREWRVSAAHLAKRDAAMARGPHADAWAELMSAAGNAVHLQRRMIGRDVHPVLRAKTGTLRDARSLAGHVADHRGRWHFAVVGDRLTGAQPWEVRELTDEVVELLARHARGCDLGGCGSP
jgi:D-alanyl-D-alanine carboxypeptidase/D-alanyl-D-alanine-endopeptidase (penicillin-binding protein 4)